MILRRGIDASHSLPDRELFLSDLRLAPPVSAVILATCDRVEVYEGQGHPGPETVRHLFRVVAGLESPFLGENQIQGQVRRAYEEARKAGFLDSGVHRLFQQALRVGKRVRTETGLNRGALGHAQAVAELIQNLPVPLKDLKLLVIGVNRLNRGLLRFLADRGHRTFFLGNRTLETARDLVSELGTGEALPLDRLAEVLPLVDAVVSSTGAPHLIVRASDLPEFGGPRWFFDLAVPRDIDPAVADRPGATLWNVSDLEARAADTLEARRSEVAQAEAILEAEVERYFVTGAPR